MKVVVTGANGFLGWHLRCRLRARHNHEVIPIGRDNFDELPAALADADAVIHLAGVNRGSGGEVANGNTELAEAVATALRASATKARVIYANSIQAGNGSPYGDGKAKAATILGESSSELGLTFVDAQLPNLFGEHGRPGYNSFVATFCWEVAAGREPQVKDNQVELLHAQDAAQVLIEGLRGSTRVERPKGKTHGVIEVLDLLKSFEGIYRHGDIPSLDTDFKLNLFNTYRAATFLTQAPIPFTKHSDVRGSFVETVRVHGGGGQTSFSTTVPGVTRGEHFHLKKIERFVVIGGRARISLRKLFTNDVVSFDVTGDAPVAIDMPTMWAHNIINTGEDELLTLFWSDTVFDPDNPDTYPEAVGLPGIDHEVGA